MSIQSAKFDIKCEVCKDEGFLRIITTHNDKGIIVSIQLECFCCGNVEDIQTIKSY